MKRLFAMLPGLILAGLLLQCDVNEHPLAPTQQEVEDQQPTHDSENQDTVGEDNY